MCGIVGYTGKKQAAPILLEGLSKLEYRGYDSAGLAVRDGEKLAQVVKAKGRLSILMEKTDGGRVTASAIGYILVIPLFFLSVGMLASSSFNPFIYYIF